MFMFWSNLAAWVLAMMVILNFWLVVPGDRLRYVPLNSDTWIRLRGGHRSSRI